MMWLARAAVLLGACASSTAPAPPTAQPIQPSDAPATVTLQAPAPAPLLAAGSSHTCASTDDGGLECWGAGTAGQLGDGSMHSRADAVRVLYLREPVLLAAGAAHTCAQDARGRLYCWGKDVLREDESTAFPVRLERGPFVALTANGEVTCGLARAGLIDCWGGGQDTRVEAPPKLAVGDRLCATDACFSIDADGARAVTRGDGPPPPADLELIEARVNGRAHASARTPGGIRCWGADSHGQLRRGGSLPRVGRWELVPGLSDVTALAATSHQVCAARRSGSVVCWGTTAEPETGLETVTLDPVPVEGLDAAVAIAADRFGDTMCAALRDGNATCWYAGWGGEEIEPPVRAVGVTGAVTISVGDGLACTGDRAGRVTCFGPNDPDRPARRVPGLPAIHEMQVVGYRGCGIDRNQRLWCWDSDGARAQQARFARRTCRGGPRYLEAHEGAIADACTQAREAPLTHVRSLVLGGGIESLALLHALVGNAGVFGYADTDTGESMIPPKYPGVGPTPPVRFHDYIEPFPLPAGTERLIGDAAAGCAISAAGAVHCWGGPYGQLPIRTALPPATDVATNLHLMCALAEDGQVRCQLLAP